METKDVVIVGSGYSGVCIAIKLKEAGINNFVILEKEEELGGTWYINTYPGAACDVQSHLYSFSFEPSDWTRIFPQQKELNVYIKHCISKYKLEPHAKVNSAVKSAIFNEQEGMWLVTTVKDEQFKTKVFLTGAGALNDPAYPEIKGMETYEGTKFHSSIWDHNFDFKNKNVAVIGSGASAIQFVPELVPLVKTLNLFQRTPNWIMPKADRPFKAWERKLFLSLPFIRKLYRESLYWGKETRVFAFVKNPKLLEYVSKPLEKSLRKFLKDPALQKAMIPDYIMGCKRILLSNNYFPSIIKENVNVITDGIDRVTKNSIITKTGKEVPVDAIIYATGFKATKILSTINIVGTAGKDLNSVWKENVEAYIGTTVSGFPNLFIMTGPNTGVGHTSMIHIIESQAAYVMQGIKFLLKGNIKSADLKSDVQKKFNDFVQKEMKNTVWQSGGCKSWYQDDKGRNPVLWPGFTVKFRKMTSKFDPSKYKLVTK